MVYLYVLETSNTKEYFCDIHIARTRSSNVLHGRHASHVNGTTDRCNIGMKCVFCYHQLSSTTYVCSQKNMYVEIIVYYWI